MNLNYLLLLPLLMGSVALASTEVVVHRGVSEAKQVRVEDQIGHTEYRYEDVQSTCSREVYAGQYCYWVTRQNCYDVRRCEDIHLPNGGVEHKCYHDRVCRPYEDRVCRPDYRTEYYSCIKSIKVPYSVKDADTVGKVDVELDAIEGLEGKINEQINVRLSGKELSLAASTQNSQAVLLGTLEQSTSGNEAGVIYVTGKAVIGGVALSEVKLATDIKEIQITDKLQVAFTLGDSQLVGQRVSLKIRKDRFIGHKTLIDRELKSDELIILKQNDGRLLVLVDTGKLGIAGDLKKGEFEVSVKVQAVLPAGKQVLNLSDIGSALQANLKNKIKRN